MVNFLKVYVEGIYEKFSTDATLYELAQPFEVLDLKHLGDRVKRTHIISHSLVIHSFI